MIRLTRVMLTTLMLCFFVGCSSQPSEADVKARQEALALAKRPAANHHPLPPAYPDGKAATNQQTPYGAATANDLLTDPSDTPAQRRYQIAICEVALEKPENLRSDDNGRSVLRGCYVLLHPSETETAPVPAFPTKEQMKRHPKWNRRMTVEKNEEWDRFQTGSKDDRKKMLCEMIFKSPSLQSTVKDWERDCAPYR